MKTLDEKVKISEYTFKDIFIPFSHMSLTKTPNSPVQTLYEKINLVGSYALLFGGAIYLSGVMNNGSLNPSKWSEIKEQREIEREEKIIEQRREQFYHLDLNNDGVIDSTEFIYRDNIK